MASLFHVLLSLPGEQRMKIQSPSQEMKGHPGVSAQHREILEAAESGLSKGCQRREDVIGAGRGLTTWPSPEKALLVLRK